MEKRTENEIYSEKEPALEKTVRKRLHMYICKAVCKSGM